MRFILCLLIACLNLGSTLIADEENVLIIESPAEANGQIELFFKLPKTPSDKLLFSLHGAGSDGFGQRDRDRLWYQYWSDKGYVVAGVSMPGYGATTGAKDFCGPLTMHILSYALKYLKAMLDIQHVGIIGHGQGGMAGLLLSTQMQDIRCVVASGGVVNLMAHKNKLDDPFMQTLVSKGYAIDVNNDEDLKNRSPIYLVDQIPCPVFVLHRDKNPMVYSEDVEEFAQKMDEQQKHCTLVVREKTPEADHQKISYQEIIEAAEEWIDLHMQ